MCANSRNGRGLAHQRGAGLIEVLVAVLVLAIGLLGIAAMQATALRNNQSSLERTQATIQTYSILDAMRANAEAARAGAYNLARTCTPPTASGTLAQRDLVRWFADMRGAMGATTGTCGTISQSGDVFTVTVEWDDGRATDTGSTAADSDRNSVTTRVRINVPI